MKPSGVKLPDPLHLTTIECLGNPVHLARPHAQQTLESIHNEKIKKRQFYRRRIIQMVKDISKDPLAYPNLTPAYNTFVDQLIDHIQDTDRSDEIQSDLLNICIANDKQVPDVSYHDSKDDVKLLGAIKGKKASLASFIGKKANKKTQIMPLERDINLMDGKFRNKGVRRKEKRVSFDLDTAV